MRKKNPQVEIITNKDQNRESQQENGEIAKSLPGDLQKSGSVPFCCLWTTQGTWEEAAVLHSSWRSRLCLHVLAKIQLPGCLAGRFFLKLLKEQKDSCFKATDLLFKFLKLHICIYIPNDNVLKVLIYLKIFPRHVSQTMIQKFRLFFEQL